MFDINGKIALITGGASGLGLKYAKELLKNGLGGITLADINEEIGEASQKELAEEYGNGKVIFVKTDVTKSDEFENAFKKTIQHFKYIDILINNAGIMNDGVWEKEVEINVNGVIHGMLLGIENYLKNYRQSDESLVVNISSIVGVKGYGYMPIYSGTKFAINGLSLGWSTHYPYTKVGVISFCPGSTNTNLLDLTVDKVIAPHYYEVDPDGKELLIDIQEMEPVAEQLVEVIKYARNGTIWIAENSKLAYEYVMPDRHTIERKTIKEYKS